VEAEGSIVSTEKNITLKSNGYVTSGISKHLENSNFDCTQSWIYFYLKLGYEAYLNFPGLQIVLNVPSSPTIVNSLISLGGVIASFHDELDVEQEWLEQIKDFDIGTKLQRDDKKKYTYIGLNEQGNPVLEEQVRRGGIYPRSPQKVILLPGIKVTRYQPKEQALVSDQYRQAINEYPYFELLRMLQSIIDPKRELPDSRINIKSSTVTMIDSKARDFLQDITISAGEMFCELSRVLAFRGCSWSVDEGNPNKSELLKTGEETTGINSSKLVVLSDVNWHDFHKVPKGSSVVSIYDRRKYSNKSDRVNSLSNNATQYYTDKERETLKSFKENLVIPIGIEIIEAKMKTQ
jgi:hypothetical protein